MTIKITNNCNLFDEFSFGLIKNFIDFCNNSHPLKKQMEVVFVNQNSTKHDDDTMFKIHILTKNKNISEIVNELSYKWIDLFSKHRKIKVTFQEPNLSILAFTEKYKEYSNIL